MTSMQPDLKKANESLRQILFEPDRAMDEFIQKPATRTTGLFFQIHFPYWVGFFLIILIAPHFWIGFSEDWMPEISRRFRFADWVAPLTPVVANLVLAIAVDRLQKFRDSPEPFSNTSYSNVSFYLQLPVSASLFWFLVHPVVGYIAVLIAIIFSLYISIRQWSRLSKRSYYQILTDYLYCVFLLMLPVVFLLLIYNILLTYKIIQIS